MSTIETQDPGDSVGYRKLGITANKQVVTLYAVYKNKDMATVDFAVNDSNWGDVDPKSGSFMVQNDKVEVNTVSSTATPREGYHFVGWYEKGALTPVSTNAKLTVTSDMMQEKLTRSRGAERRTERPPCSWCTMSPCSRANSVYCHISMETAMIKKPR